MSHIVLYYYYYYYYYHHHHHHHHHRRHHHHHHHHRGCRHNHYHHHHLLPLCNVFKITYLKQTVLLGYMALTAILYLQFTVPVMLFPMFNVLYF